MRRAHAADAAAAGLLAAAAILAALMFRPAAAPLRVCADPNNLPFSNDREEGFENRLAAMLAQELGTRVEYTWRAQRRGFVRQTLAAGACDVIVGVPAGFEPVETTRPYYRSTYVFVSRQDRGLRPRSLDDPHLERLRIGVQMIGDDFANSPPAHALSARGLVKNVVGYSVLGDYSQPNPPARIVEAVAAGDIDVAVVWGPLAGYFARRQPAALVLSPVEPQAGAPFRPFAFDISMGVRRGDAPRRRLLDGFIAARRAEIDRVLDEYGVPRVDARVGRTGL
jgi:quinoprotein dehydrogenase-associated probable ABC transporter substrate-binding protein